MPIFQGTGKTRFESQRPQESKSAAALATAIQRLEAGAAGLLTGVSGLAGLGQPGASPGAHESFTGDGTQSLPRYNTNDTTVVNFREPQRRSQIAQRPKATVLIKKKQFSTLGQNYDLRFMDDDERLYLLAVQNLMRRKCDEIAFYESLVDFNSAYETDSFLRSDGALDAFVTLANSIAQSGLSDLLGALSFDTSILRDLYNIRMAGERSRASTYTRWVEQDNSFAQNGQLSGTGTIELNLVTSINTALSVSGDGDSGTIMAEDPYGIMTITDSDVEIAVRMAIGQRNGIVQDFGTGTPRRRLDTARALDEVLIASMSDAGRPPIRFELGEFSPSDQQITGEGVGVKIYVPAAAPGQSDGKFLDRITDADGEEYALTQRQIALANAVARELLGFSAASSSVVSQFASLSADFGPLRARMRQDFLGHNLVQPMDQVSVFINSNTSDVTPEQGAPRPILTGTSAIAAYLPNLTTSRDALSDSAIEQERAELAPSVPFAIYKLFRRNDVWRDDGNSVFVGLVTNVSTDYEASDGRYTHSMAITSNMEYTRISRVMTTTDLTSSFTDVDEPLTPFDIDSLVDPTTGLIRLSGGQLQLSSSNRRRLPYLKIYDGSRAGETPRSQSDLYVDSSDQLFLQHTPGLTYQWKRGIISAVTTSRSPTTDFSAARNAASVISKPFAGLDPANIASILLTGRPYDYNSFLTAARNASSYNPAATPNQYFNFLFDVIGRTAQYYGNFVSAKDTSLDREAVVALFQAAQNIRNSSRELRRELNIKLGQVDGPDARFEQLKSQLSSTISATSKILPAGGKILISGIEATPQLDDAGVRLSRYRVRRKPEEVRYGTDRNYFIVSSRYDTDLQIQASNILRGEIRIQAELYNRDFKTPRDIIRDASSALNLEFFCDSDGNLVLRPPQYNRVPLSLLAELQVGRAAGSVDLLPPFVRGLLNRRLEGVSGRIYRNALNIGRSLRILKILGSTAEIATITDNLIGSGAVGAAQFAYPDVDAGYGFVVDIAAVVQNAETSIQLGAVELAEFAIAAASKNRPPVSSPDSEIEKIDADLSRLDGNDPADPAVAATIATSVKEECDALLEPKFRNQTMLSELDRLATLLTERSQLARTMSAISRRTSGAAQNTLGGVADALLGPSINAIDSLISGIVSDTPTDPELESVIEQDVRNDDGPRSGARFIIRDDVVLSSSFSLGVPDFTQIRVNGEINLIGQLPVQTNTATATDFDLWRQYGFRATQEITRPDMSDAESQLAPFAVFKLIEQRRQLHSGRVTVVGNEYYRQGDNVYYASRGMMYYVDSVSHSLNLNSGQYSTTLVLTYGRPLGEFLPTVSDLVGSSLLATSAVTRRAGVIRKPRRQDESSEVMATAICKNYPTLLTSLGLGGIGGAAVNRILEQFSSGAETAARTAVLKASVRRSRRTSAPTQTVADVLEIRAYYWSVDGQTETKTRAAADALARATKELVDSVVAAMGQPGADAVPTEIHLIDLRKPLTADDKKYHRLPSEDAWSEPQTVARDIRAVVSSAFSDAGGFPESDQLPLAGIDIAYVVRNRAPGNI